MNPLRRGGGPLVLAALLVLGGCSGTSFGRRLAGSFDPPVASPSDAPAATPGPGAPQAAANGSSGAGPQTATTAQPSTVGKPFAASPDATVKPRTPVMAPTGTNAPSAKTSTAGGKAGTTAGIAMAAKGSPGKSTAPVPYRVTIKLPTADPSAPAEAVTEALRAAGIRFEVETIERIRNGVAPAPAAAAPQATPAPAPR